MSKQIPPAGANAGDDELDENVKYLVNLRVKTMSIAEQIVYVATKDVVHGEDVPQSVSDVMETTVKVIVDTYNKALKNAEELAKAYDSGDFKNVLLNAIEIYANIDIVNFIAKNLIEVYVFRYARHGFIAEKENKLEKISEVVISLLNKKVIHYLLAPSEYPELLNNVMEGIRKFYDIYEPDSDEFDYLGRDLRTLRDQIEDDSNEDIDKAKYAILSDLLDLVQDSFGGAILDGMHAYYSVDNSLIGTSEVCDAYDDPAQFSIYCDDERDNAYKADKINFTRLLEDVVNAYAGFKKMMTIYSILKQHGISDENFEEDTNELVELTKDMIQTIIGYYVR